MSDPICINCHESKSQHANSNLQCPYGKQTKFEQGKVTILGNCVSCNKPYVEHIINQGFCPGAGVSRYKNSKGETKVSSDPGCEHLVHLGLAKCPWEELDKAKKYVDSHLENIGAMKNSPRVPGLDPNMPTVTNEKGGKQSDTPYGLVYIPALALLAESKVLKRGADKYGERNWEKIPVKDHINHALQHLYAYLAGDRSDNHLANAACRVHFALDLEEQSKQKQGVLSGTLATEMPRPIVCIDCQGPLGDLYYGAGDGTGQKFRCAKCNAVWEVKQQNIINRITYHHKDCASQDDMLPGPCNCEKKKNETETIQKDDFPL